MKGQSIITLVVIFMTLVITFMTLVLFGAIYPRLIPFLALVAILLTMMFFVISIVRIKLLNAEEISRNAGANRRTKKLRATGKRMKKQ